MRSLSRPVLITKSCFSNERPSDSGWLERWGRNRVYNDSGQDVTISDGAWIKTLGTFGILGLWLSLAACIVGFPGSGRTQVYQLNN